MPLHVDGGMRDSDEDFPLTKFWVNQVCPVACFQIVSSHVGEEQACDENRKNNNETSGVIHFQNWYEVTDIGRAKQELTD